MLQMRLDHKNNLLSFDVSCHLSAREARQCLFILPEYLAQLKPAFSILTNLSGLETFDHPAVSYMKQMMDACNEKGVSKVIRVIPLLEKDIGLNIMSCFHYNQNVHILTCHNLEEALSRLKIKDFSYEKKVVF